MTQHAPHPEIAYMTSARTAPTPTRAISQIVRSIAEYSHFPRAFASPLSNSTPRRPGRQALRMARLCLTAHPSRRGTRTDFVSEYGERSCNLHTRPGRASKRKSNAMSCRVLQKFALPVISASIARSYGRLRPLSNLHSLSDVLCAPRNIKSLASTRRQIGRCSQSSTQSLLANPAPGRAGSPIILKQMKGQPIRGGSVRSLIGV